MTIIRRVLAVVIATVTVSLLAFLMGAIAHGEEGVSLLKTVMTGYLWIGAIVATCVSVVIITWVFFGLLPALWRD